MEQDRIKWNRKYAGDPRPRQPAGIVKKYYSLAPVGQALDIAAGLGGNSLFLADRGFRVDAVDISDTAVNALKGTHPGVTAICEDLDTFALPENHYGLILNIRFLSRRLFPYIKAALTPGGVFIAETYLEGGPGDAAHMSCRDYLLRPNELLHAFLSLTVVFYEERDSDGGSGPGRIAGLVGVRPC
ncbi:MAG TPA: class I SAM-dependent methyltransferase [Desulfosarcina sp.]|nr:class I SAM-dependent methyltransferase [Desulfosarcina sp.]